MKYPNSKNPKLVCFLLLKLYHTSDYGILSRNFYWLHLFGGDYKLLEPYGMKKITLKIASKVFIKGFTYKVRTFYYVIPIKITFKVSIQGEYERKKDFISRIDRSRILPVHYSDNYFSLVSSEVIPIKITFKFPPGVML